jgi:hypothetical protein
VADSEWLAVGAVVTAFMVTPVAVTPVARRLRSSDADAPPTPPGGHPMTLGPLEYLVIGFDGDRFDGSIAREIEKVVDRGIIRLVDVVFITREANGESVIVELSNTDDPRFVSFAPLLAQMRALFTPEDLVEIADSLPLGTAGLVLLFEHAWAEDLKDAIGANGGFLVRREVIPPEVLAEVSAQLEAESAAPSA